MWCYDCENLNKSMIQRSAETDCYRYGCRHEGHDGFILGWIRKDSELKWMGGSCYRAPEKSEQMSLFERTA